MLADIKGPHLDFFGGPNSLSHGSDHGRPQGGKTGVYPLEIGTKKDNFLENVKSTV